MVDQVPQSKNVSLSEQSTTTNAGSPVINLQQKSAVVAISTITSLRSLDRVASVVAALGASTRVRVLGNADAVASAVTRLRPFFDVSSAVLSLQGTAARSAESSQQTAGSPVGSMRGDKPIR